MWLSWKNHRTSSNSRGGFSTDLHSIREKETAPLKTGAPHHLWHGVGCQALTYLQKSSMGLNDLDMGNSNWKKCGFSPSTNGKFMGNDDLVFTCFYHLTKSWKKSWPWWVLFQFFLMKMKFFLLQRSSVNRRPGSSPVGRRYLLWRNSPQPGQPPTWHVTHRDTHLASLGITGLKYQTYHLYVSGYVED